MSNTHGTPDTLKEWQAIGGDLLPACLLTSSGMTTPGSGLTLTAASCTAYARSASDLVYIDQPAVSVTVPNVAGSHWLIAHRDTHSAVAGWTRRAGSHFLTQQAASQPTIPDGAVLVAQLTVSGGNITAVDTTPALSPPLSRQTADAVAITGGTVSVATLVATSPGAGPAGNFALDVWPGAGLLWALAVGGAPGSPLPQGYAYVVNRVGIAQPAPAYPLDVAGNVRVQGNIGVQTAPNSASQIQIMQRRDLNNHGITIQAYNHDTNGLAMQLVNQSGGAVGSIYCTATTTAFNTSSDARLKHAVQALTGALDAVQALRPVKFRWNSDDSLDIGFLAHELQREVPTAVTGEPDAVEEDGSVKPQQVDHSKLVPILVAAVKELLARVEVLEQAFA